MEIKCCEAEKICYQYILRISRVFSLFFANLLRSDCPLISPQSSAFLNGLLLYTGALAFLNSSLKTFFFLLLEEETHLALHDGHTEKHVLKLNLSKNNFINDNTTSSSSSYIETLT